MIQVSEKAAEALHATLEQNQTEPTDVLRIEQSDAGLALSIGAQHDGDQLVDHGNRVILAIDAEVADALSGATIDAVEAPGGLQLVVTTEPGGAF
jgi:Fe-S cluster assembly iron-binding protein IscA